MEFTTNLGKRKQSVEQTVLILHLNRRTNLAEGSRSRYIAASGNGGELSRTELAALY